MEHPEQLGKIIGDHVTKAIEKNNEDLLQQVEANL